MKYEDTICAKIKSCLREIEKGAKHGEMDIGAVAQLLVAIQGDAIRMEMALKANKILRNKHHIDEEYRTMMQESATSSATINDLPNANYYTEDIPSYHLVLTERTGKVIYDGQLHAFIMCAVEQISDIDEEGIINGTTNTLAIGHDMAVWYAFDQLQQKFAAKMTELMVKMGNGVRTGQFRNRAERRRLLRRANRTQ